MADRQNQDEIQSVLDAVEAKRRLDQVMSLDEPTLRRVRTEMQSKALKDVTDNDVVRTRRACAAWAFGATEDDLVAILTGSITRLHRFHPILRDFP